MQYGIWEVLLPHGCCIYITGLKMLVRGTERPSVLSPERRVELGDYCFAEAAGAEFLVLCTNTMHKVAPAIEEAVRIRCSTLRARPTPRG
jgi:hypothetical protein